MAEKVPNGDLISRRTAIKALDEQIKQCNKALGSFDISMKDEYAVRVERASLLAYRETIKTMPSAQPERKTGKWIDGSVLTYSACSVCGYQERYASENNFCPNCGADMNGGKEE